MRAYCHGLVVVEIVVIVIEMINIVMMMLLIACNQTTNKKNNDQRNNATKPDQKHIKHQTKTPETMTPTFHLLNDQHPKQKQHNKTIT